MLGYTFSTAAASDLLIACKEQAKLDWKPVFLDNNQANLIAEISETILPQTATPGAKELGLPQFIDKMLKELLNEKDQQELMAGLKDFEKKCDAKYNKSFTELTQAEKEAFLIEQDKASPGFPISMWGINLDPNPKPITFYRRIKSLALMGYFTSEKIGKEVLVYDPVPGHYDGCIPLSGQNAWAE